VIFLYNLNKYSKLKNKSNLKSLEKLKIIISEDLIVRLVKKRYLPQMKLLIVQKALIGKHDIFIEYSFLYKTSLGICYIQFGLMDQ